MILCQCFPTLHGKIDLHCMLDLQIFKYACNIRNQHIVARIY